MGDEQTAETLANDETKIETPVNDGVVDLDAPVEVKAEADEGKTDGEAAAGEKDAGEETKKLSGAARGKIREQRLLGELSAREREIEELRRSQPAAKDAGADEAKPPREEDFNGDWFAFQRALTAFDAGKAVRDEIRKDRETRDNSERSKQQTEIARERDVAHLERVEDAKEVIADFDQVMAGMKGVSVRNEVIDEIKASEKSALLAYHLAKNPEKLQALNAMSGRELAREMGRLEGSIRMPAANKQTKAPPPLDPLKGGASGAFDPTTASMDDYVAKRKAGWKG